MGTKKIDKEFLWLKVLHLINDSDTVSAIKLTKELNKIFFIKERKK